MINRLHETTLNGNDWTLECVGGAFPRISATVPGNIQADLEAAKCLKPIYYGLGDERIWEVARHDWWYHKDFTIPVDWNGKRIKLCIDGVDYSCEVYLDGIKLVEHEGQFERFSVDITQYVFAGKTHRLSILVHRMPEELEDYIVKSDGAGSGEGTPYWFVIGMNRTRQVLRGLKSITNFSYDWGTNIWTLGIWKDVKIIASDEAMINDLRVQSEPDNTFEKAFIRATWEIDSLKDTGGMIDIKIRCREKELHFKHEVQLKAGNNKVTWEETIDSPELWWPAGYGGQPLYTLDSKLHIEGNSCPSDGYSVRFGIRRFEWGQLENAPEDFINPLKLMVNGRQIRTIGSNMTSTDLLHGRAHDKARLFVRRAREAGFNTLRMHGGQIIFTEDFYDACDEMGILLSIDFPVGNCMLEEDNDIVEHWVKVVRDIVILLRNHPCIMEWSGGNEMAWQQDTVHPALTAAREIIEEEDGRIFRATCPAQGVRHAPWDYNPLIHYKLYNDENMRDQTGKYPMMRNGEFGCQTPGNLELLRKTIPPESRFPVNIDDPVLIRKNMVRAVFIEDGWLMPGNIKYLFGEPETFEELVTAAQWMGAEGIRYAFDLLRSRTDMGGFTSWCFNEPWPNGAGTFLVDYEGRPVPMFYGAAQAMKPVILFLKLDSILYDIFDGMEAELMLCSDAGEDMTGLRWHYVLRDRHGEVYRTGEGVADIKPLEAKSLGKVRIEPPIAVRNGPVLMELYLDDNQGRCLAERLYVFGAFGAMAPLAGLLRHDQPDTEFGSPPTYTGITGSSFKRTSIDAGIIGYSSDGTTETLRIRVKNTGEMTALYFEIHPLLLYRTDITVEGQYGFIPAGEYRDITVTAPAGSDLTLLQTGWYVTAYNADRTEIPPRDVLLRTGRRDGTCEGFEGFYNAELKPRKEFYADPENGSVAAGEVPYLWDNELVFHFYAGQEQSRKAVALCIYSADQSENGADIRVSLNGSKKSERVSPGYGLQKNEPWQLAAPGAIVVEFPPGVIKEGKNVLSIDIENGWITIDAMNLRIV